MKNLMICAFLLLTLLGCERKDKEVSKAKMMNIALAPPAVNMQKSANQDAASPGTNDVAKKIIREGEISFETKNIALSRKSINNALQKLNGYVAEENITNDTIDTRVACFLRVRIPEKNFDLFLENISESAGKLDSKNIHTRDVTSDYIDFTVQITNKKRLEERYLELLKKGTKISDLLEIENKINQIQTTIDSTQEQLNYLLKQVEYSTLNIIFYTKKAPASSVQTFGSKLIHAISDGWEALTTVFVALLSVWPLWVIGIAVWFIIKTWRRNNPPPKVNT